MQPLARVVARQGVGSDPELMLDGPIPATRRVLERDGLSIDQIDMVEINGAFASVVLAWAHELQPDSAWVNPNGGAIAHGHPLGAAGAVLNTKLVHELQRLQGRSECRPCVSAMGWPPPPSLSGPSLRSERAHPCSNSP